MNRGSIVYEIAELLDLPGGAEHGGKAHEVVSAFVKVLTDSLLQGKSIRVVGFGEFKTIIRSSRRGSRCRTPGRKRWVKGDYREIVYTPPSPRIVFKPSPALLRFINS